MTNTIADIFNLIINGDLYWREPLWLLLFLLPGFIVLLSYFYQKILWKKIAEPNLLPWVKTDIKSSIQIIRISLFAFAWLFFTIALAGPRTPEKIPPSIQNDSVSMMVLIDFSRSMQAVDKLITEQARSRITQAQDILNHWLNDFPPQLKMGLMIYSGHSHTLLPPTSDTSVLRHYITQLKQFNPPTLGNNLAQALDNAYNLLNQLQNQAIKKQVVLVLSDGDLGKQAGDNAKLSASKFKKNKQLNLFVIGVGGDEAVKIPTSDYKYLTINGNVIVSRRQTLWLKQLTQQANGFYYPLELIKQQKLAQLLKLAKPRINPKLNHQVLWNEWFFIPLILGVILALIGLHMRAKKTHKLSMLILILLLSGCSEGENEALTNKQLIEKIDKSLSLENYNQVLTLSKLNYGADHTTSLYIQFSQGVACYRLKKYRCAQQVFSSIVWTFEKMLWNQAENNITELHGKAVFNLANTHFKLGDYRQAAVLFEYSMQRGIPPPKAKINLQFAKSLAMGVSRHLADIEKTKQRADWLASARKLPEGFDDTLAEGFYFSQFKAEQSQFYRLPDDVKKVLLEKGIKYIQTSHKISANTAGNKAGKFWVLSEQNSKPQQTAALFNQLMSFEVGIPYASDEALEIKGQRSW